MRDVIYGKVTGYVHHAPYHDNTYFETQYDMICVLRALVFEHRVACSCFKFVGCMYAVATLIIFQKCELEIVLLKLIMFDEADTIIIHRLKISHVY